MVVEFWNPWEACWYDNKDYNGYVLFFSYYSLSLIRPSTMKGYIGFIVVTFYRVKLIKKNCFSSVSTSIDRFTITLISRKLKFSIITSDLLEIIVLLRLLLSITRHLPITSSHELTFICIGIFFPSSILCQSTSFTLFVFDINIMQEIIFRMRTYIWPCKTSLDVSTVVIIC